MDEDYSLFPGDTTEQFKNLISGELDTKAPRYERKSTDSDMYKEESYEIKYYVGPPMKALFIHGLHLFLGPLSLPILYMACGHNLLSNMSFRASALYFIGEIGPWVWTILTLYIISSQSEDIDKLYYSMITSFIVIALRIALVTLKYGYYSKKEWNLIQNKKFSCSELISQSLLKVWMIVPPEIAERELLYSYRRQMMETLEMQLHFVYIHKEFREKYGLNKSSETQNSLNVLSLSKLFIHEVSRKERNPDKYMSWIIALGYSSIPVFINYFGIKDGFDLTTLGWFYFVFCIPYSLMFCLNFLLLVIVGVYDFQRKLKLQRICTDLIDHRKKTCLNMENIGTILAWYTMRNSFLDFGRPYTLRVFLYSSLILPTCVIIVVLIFLIVLGIIQEKYVLFFVSPIYLVMFTLFLLCKMIFKAVSINKYFDIHQDLLTVHIARMMNKGDTYTPEQKKVMKTLKIVIEKLKKDELVRPVNILGIKMDSAMYARVLALAISAFLAIIKLALI